MLCPICGASFSPRDSRQKHCSKACGSAAYGKTDAVLLRRRLKYYKNREKIAADRRERYRSDPEYRKSFVDAMKKRRAEVPDRVRDINAKYRHKPRNMERARQASRLWHAENSEYANARRSSRTQKQRVTYPWSILIAAAKTRSVKKGLPFDLTNEWAQSRWTGRCELTGLPFTLGLRGSGAKLFSASIDKIDPSLGYTKTNSRFVIWAINAFKYDGDDSTMYFIARALLNNQQQSEMHQEAAE